MATTHTQRTHRNRAPVSHGFARAPEPWRGAVRHLPEEEARLRHPSSPPEHPATQPGRPGVASNRRRIDATTGDHTDQYGLKLRRKPARGQVSLRRVPDLEPVM